MDVKKRVARTRYFGQPRGIDAMRNNVCRDENESTEKRELYGVHVGSCVLS